MSTNPAEHALLYVRAIDPYEPGKPIEETAREYGLDPAAIIKMASNENPLGIPESAIHAVNSVLRNGFRYPDGNAYDLKKAIAEKYDLPISWIIQGNGSDEILELIAAATLEPGKKCIFSQYSFSVYQLSAQANGALSVEVPTKNFQVDLDGIAAQVDEDTRLIYITNPNNPTGLILSAKDVEDFLVKIPQDVVVILDEAYRDFMPEELRTDSFALVRRYPNLMVTRTFSKAYGLAGLRIGFAVAQAPMVELLNRIRPPFNANLLAQAAAVSVLKDEAFLNDTYEMNRNGMVQLTTAFDEMGLEYLPSYANFIMLKVGDAAAVNEALLRAGVIVRGLRSYGLLEYLRISVGLPAENERFLEVLRRTIRK